MDIQSFWSIIGQYNEHTKYVQAVLFIILISSLLLSYSGRVKWMAKLVLGIINIYIKKKSKIKSS